MKSDVIERVASVALAVAAVVMTVTVTASEWRSTATKYATRQPTPRPAAQLPYVHGWEQLVHLGRSIGDSLGTIHIIEFGDLECPACKYFQESVLSEIRQTVPATLDIRFVHLPLTMHRFARQAAVAAECAADVDRFASFIDATYRQQDSIGLRPWSQYAQDAGVVDTVEFARCVKNSSSRAAIDSGTAVAKRLGIHVTPTLLVNGWSVTPASDELSRVIAVLSRNENPYPDADTTQRLRE
jgi:protein-disulfide isomerase